MARKTFISYKFSEAQAIRDSILNALGDDATYYQGETSESPDLADATTDYIKKVLADMMYDTSVTIVVVSPRARESKWIDWEIEYSLKEISRQDRTSKTNGVVGVIQKAGGGYEWLASSTVNGDGCSVRFIDDSWLYDIISSNRYNKLTAEYACTRCRTFDPLVGSYISLINEEEFLGDPDRYIENAFDKAENANDYRLVKQR